MTAFNRIGRYLTFTIRADLCGRLCRFLRLFDLILPDSQFRQLVDTFYQQEDHKGHDKEIDHRSQERTIFNIHPPDVEYKVT